MGKSYFLITPTRLECVRIQADGAHSLRLQRTNRSAPSVQWELTIRALALWHPRNGGALILIVSMRSTMGLNRSPTPRLRLKPRLKTRLKP